MKKKSILVLCRVVPLAIVFALGINATTDLIANPAKLALSMLQQNCVDCHGGAEVNADVNLKTLRNARHLRNAPGLLVKMINAVSDKTMPPEDAVVLDDGTRRQLLDALGEVLRQVEFETVVMADGMARLNRFQYNNTIKDLFELKSDVFSLPEKLITRHDPYLTSDRGVMPDRVRVESLTLRP
ncbi:MAG: c-type cytochrome domain-containing protein, partial [Planctomycetota bacterium]|nr:c-type cytochrome domain-containing protein [Planctomycetota bacterium]